MGTTKSSEDYLEAILVIRRLRGSCRTWTSPGASGRSKPSVTKALSNLAAAGPRSGCPGATCSHEGGRARRVRDARAAPLLRALLVESGVDAKTASAEACRMEHCLSEDSFRKLADRLAPETGAA